MDKISHGLATNINVFNWKFTFPLGKKQIKSAHYHACLWAEKNRSECQHKCRGGRDFAVGLFAL